MNEKRQAIIYISGKITGEPIMECVEKFQDAEDAINYDPDFLLYLNFSHSKGEGFSTIKAVNPLNLSDIRFGVTHEDAMGICTDALSKCTHAYFLKDWKKSRGARSEHRFCEENNIKIRYE